MFENNFNLLKREKEKKNMENYLKIYQYYMSP